MRRLCDGKEETVAHRVSVCPKFGQKECSVARMTHWRL